MNFFVVNPKSRYHPYGPKYLSTLTNKGYRKLKLSTSFAEPLVWSRGNGVPRKLEWDFGGLKLNRSQEMVYKHLEDQVVSGTQFFVHSGPAGTGKSVVLKKFVNFVRCHHSREEACFVAAPLGMAACKVDGVTIHTLLGLFPGVTPFTRLCSQACDALYEI
ncbi:unnamed protein product [Caenorhabditis brenneri]